PEINKEGHRGCGRHERGRPRTHPVAPPPRTARGLPDGKQGRGTALLRPSPPSSVTIRTPGGRQRYRAGR
ncbi:hypothetical protein O4J56_08530, partial [Nocardiopsis sp. RSe5-2]